MMGCVLPIDADEVRRIAALARLELDAASIAMFRRQLEAVLDHVARLDEIDPEPGPAGRFRGDDGPPLREDREVPGLRAEEALRGAPESAGGHFRVPRILGG
jgi:aspartyl-tRNA(Asn)/glutamyl-tRNA(Gln) amidotransferase subunit C